MQSKGRTNLKTNRAINVTHKHPHLQPIDVQQATHVSIIFTHMYICMYNFVYFLFLLSTFHKFLAISIGRNGGSEYGLHTLLVEYPTINTSSNTLS